MNYLKTILKATIIICYSFFGGILFYRKLAIGYLGIELFFFGILFLLFSAAGMGISFKKSEQKRINGPKIWLMVMLFTCLLMIAYHGINNSSKTVFIAEFSWDGGIILYLRENGTYKSINDDFFSGSIKYGSYERYEKEIIIKDEIRLGMSTIKDTLRYDTTGLYFELDRDWKGIE